MLFDVEPDPDSPAPAHPAAPVIHPEPPVVPCHSPSHSPSPSPPASPSSPLAPEPDVCRGTRTCHSPGEWWKVQTHREPAPAVESSEDEGSVNEADEDEDGDIPGAFLAGLQEDSEFAFTASIGPEPLSYRQALKHSDAQLRAWVWYRSATARVHHGYGRVLHGFGRRSFNSD
jgi:hypothetical protein